MNCRKCGSKCKRRRAGEFYCTIHGDMPKAIPAEPMPAMFGPWPDVIFAPLIRAKGAKQ